MRTSRWPAYGRPAALITELHHFYRLDRAVRPEPFRRTQDMCRPQYLTAPLTPREDQVLRCIASGLSNPQIAAELVIETSTAKAHVQRLLAKLGAKNRAHATAIGFYAGLLNSDLDLCPAHRRT